MILVRLVCPEMFEAAAAKVDRVKDNPWRLPEALTTLVALLFLGLQAIPACAQAGVVPASPNQTGPQGSAVIVGFNCVDNVFSNLFKCASWFSGPTDYPGVLDANGYPNNGKLRGNLNGIVPLPWDYCTTGWVLDWQATSFGTSAAPAFSIAGLGPVTGWGRISVLSGKSFVARTSSPAVEMDVFGAAAHAGSYGEMGGRVIFTFNNCNKNPSAPLTANGLSAPIKFLANAATSGITKMRLYRCTGMTIASCTSAIAAADASPYGGLTSLFVNSLLAAQPGWIRWLGTIGESNVENALTRYAYRRPVSAFSYHTMHFVPSQWAGKITCPTPANGLCGSDQLSVNLAGQSISDGLLIQGYVADGTVTNAPCLALNAGTCYPIVGEGAGAIAAFTASISNGDGSCNSSSAYSGTAGNCMIVTRVSSGTLFIGAMVYGQNVFPGTTIVSQSSGKAGGAGSYVLSQNLNVSNRSIDTGGLNSTLSQNSLVQFTWDASLKVWQYTATQFSMDWTPIEVMADICNTINANCWYNIPGFLVHDGSMGEIARTFLNRLNPELKLGVEFCNEVWNFAYGCTGYSEIYGQSVLGLPISADETIHSYYGVKFKTFMSDIAATVGTNNPRIYGVMAAQYYGSAWSVYENARFLGQHLCGNSCGNATYAANAKIICGQTTCDFDSKPNRPIDAANAISGAPYVQGNEVNYSAQRVYQNTLFQAATNNFSALARAADRWAVGDKDHAYNFITNDLVGSSSQLLPGQHSIFTLKNPYQTNVNGGNFQFTFVGIGTFTGNTSGSDRTVNITNLRGNVEGVTPVLYADPVNGTVLSTNNNSFSAMLVSQQSGTHGGNGTYTLSVPLKLTNQTVRFSGSFLSNWEQMALDLSGATGNAIKFLPYEQAWQITGPTIPDCSSMRGGPLRENPKRYCADITGRSGEVLVGGYKIGDELSYSGGGLTGFVFVIDQVGPDGTPLTGHIKNGGRGGSDSVTNVQLTGGSGFDIQADLTESGGSVTAVALYSQIIVEMLYDYMQSPAFRTVTNNLYNLQRTFQATIGVANSGYAGNQPVGSPWPLFYGNLSGGSKLQSWYSFQQQNGGHGGYLLNRDLDPAGNDNTPAWLDRAALASTRMESYFSGALASAVASR